jgi:hypothetical protein
VGRRTPGGAVDPCRPLGPGISGGGRERVGPGGLHLDVDTPVLRQDGALQQQRAAPDPIRSQVLDRATLDELHGLDSASSSPPGAERLPVSRMTRRQTWVSMSLAS